MSNNTLRNPKHREKVLVRTKNESQSSWDLRRLLSLLEKNTLRPERELSCSGEGRSAVSKRSQGSHLNDCSTTKSELNVNLALQKFSEEYENQRNFSDVPLQRLFSRVLTSLVKNRLCSEWTDSATPGSVLKVLTCLRILVRDSELQKLFHQHQGITSLARLLECVSLVHTSSGAQACDGQMLVTMTCMIQKMSASYELRLSIMEAGVHGTLVNLLSSSDSGVLLGALSALTALAHPDCREQIGELQIVEILLVILQEYDLLSKRACAELLRLLCSVRDVRQQLRALRGVPALLSLLHEPHMSLLWSVCWVLVQICEDSEARAEIRSWGGVQQLLRLLNSDRRYISDRSSTEILSSANAAVRVHRQPLMEELSPVEQHDSIAALQAACITALTELSLDDSCAHDIVQENGVFIISKFILPQACAAKAFLQCYAFRALRFLFSVERNRHLFKRLFPTDLFEMFIDVGHYVRELAAYHTLHYKVLLYSEEELEMLRDRIEAVDQTRPPLRVISEFSVLDHLGTGAFGTVYKVRKSGSQTLLALKEVNLHNPAFGKDKKSRDSNVEKIISELSIIREQMDHPNIVKYYKTFLEGEKLYILMELIEGVPLAEHFNSLKEKKQRFTEDRVWNIFIQMCLALRYLHRDKRIVHRDLSPNNIMLGEMDKVTITDFGLAKQKLENSKLTSVVGTILYSCPEVVKSEPYGEKADVWALGCVLYQMVTLKPPFHSNNMLSLANKIVEAQYEPVDSSSFSERVVDMIRWCLSPEPDHRPDIVDVSSRISDLLLRAMDQLHNSHNALERRAQRDRKRALTYFQQRSHVCSVPEKLAQLTPRDQTVAQIAGEDSDEEDELLDPKLSNSSAELCGFSPKLCLSSEQFTRRECASAKSKSRTVSTAAALCVSQNKLRQIDDPVNRLLLQLHKLIFITQLPPAPQSHFKRHLVDRFKKTLFSRCSDPHSVKGELSKLLHASSELIELSLDWSLLHHPDSDCTADGVTYEQMQGFIEELLEENNYYRSTHSRCTIKGQE